MLARSLLILTTILALAGTAFGGTQTTELQIPSDPLTGQILFITYLGPPQGYVTKVSLDLTFITDGTFPAEDLAFDVHAPTLPGFPEWFVTGADLGWGQGAGTWTGTIETESLNGEIFNPGGPFSIWDVTILTASGVGGVTGQFIDSAIVIEYSLTPPDPEPELRRGDANGDGVVNGLTDSLHILAFQFSGGEAPPCMDAADTDDDGVFNGLVDALYLLAYQFTGGPPPPAPGPEACGPDPTDDTVTCEVTPCP